MMLEKDIRNFAELDEAIEKNGGMAVVPPESVRHSKDFEKNFTIMRKYCVKNKIAFSDLTDEDYKKMGISSFDIGE